MMYKTTAISFASMAMEAKLEQCRDFPRKAYEGVRLCNYCLIRVNGMPIIPSPQVKKLSHGFEWGHIGAGSHQLAYTLLADLFGDEKLEVISAYHEKLLNEIISQLPTQENWLITDTDILSILGGESDFNTQLSRYCRH